MSGHVGDGNFHFLLILDPTNEKEREQAHWFTDRLIGRALRMDGTCSGEHGMGHAKTKWVPQKFGEGLWRRCGWSSRPSIP